MTVLVPQRSSAVAGSGCHPRPSRAQGQHEKHLLQPKAISPIAPTEMIHAGCVLARATGDAPQAIVAVEAEIKPLS